VFFLLCWLVFCRGFWCFLGGVGEVGGGGSFIIVFYGLGFLAV